MGVEIKTALVINPRSGGKKSDRLRKALVDAFHGLVPAGEVVETRKDGGARHVVNELLHLGYECIAVAGGDGSLNEAANGFFDEIPVTVDPAGGDAPRPVNPSACMAVIPVGTGGDFRRTMGLEPDPVAALSLLTGTSTRKCDLGHVSYVDREGRPAGRLFINITSFGMSGLVDEYVNRSGRAMPGSLSFFVATVRAFSDYENVAVDVRMGSAEPIRRTAVAVAVANGRFFGGGMEVAPEARVDDGLLDVVILGDLGLYDFVVNARKLYGGKILGLPDVDHGRVQRVAIETVEADARMLMDLDGEPVGRLPATLTILPGAIGLKS